jgi:hypothetical protein
LSLVFLFYQPVGSLSLSHTTSEFSLCSETEQYHNTIKNHLQ